MEEFLYRETNDMHRAIVEGKSITWPTKCRNCDFVYTPELKDEVYTMIMNNHSDDMLRVISSSFRSVCTGFNYCCINNYKPKIESSSDFVKDPNVNYHVFTNSLVIEDGLTDWYDVTWDDEDESVIPEVNNDNHNGPVSTELSLFDLLEGIGTQ